MLSNKKKYLDLAVLFLLSFLFCMFFAWNSVVRKNINIDSSEANEIYLLQEYYHSDKIISGGSFSSERYRDVNQEYGNIFSFFELPADKNGYLVPLKGWGRLILKFPIFLFSGPTFFWGVWKVLGLFLTLGFFAIILRDSSTSKKILCFFTLWFFLPETSFEIEFTTLFLALVSLFLFMKNNRKLFLFIYFIFAFYGAIMRNEFFVFFSISNLYLLFYFFYTKRYAFIFLVALFSAIFISTMMIGNYHYYGGFLNFGYTIEKAGGSSIHVKESLPLFERIFSQITAFLFPYFDLYETYKNIVYTFNNKVGLILFLAFLHYLTSKKKYFSLKKSYFSSLLVIFVLYGFILYGSNPWYYKPINDSMASSYMRYFSSLLCLLYFLFYSHLFNRVKFLSTILFCIFVFLYSFDDMVDQHFRKIRIEKGINQILEIPSGSTIFPAKRMTELLFLNYYSLQPSGEDNMDFRTLAQGKTSEHPFLEKVYSYMKETQNSIYIPKGNQGVLLFFEKRNADISNLNSFYRITVSSDRKTDNT